MRKEQVVVCSTLRKTCTQTLFQSRCLRSPGKHDMFFVSFNKSSGRWPRWWNLTFMKLLYRSLKRAIYSSIIDRNCSYIGSISSECCSKASIRQRRPMALISSSIIPRGAMISCMVITSHQSVSQSVMSVSQPISQSVSKCDDILHEGIKNGNHGHHVRCEGLDMILLEELRVEPILVELASSAR